MTAFANYLCDPSRYVTSGEITLISFCKKYTSAIECTAIIVKCQHIVDASYCELILKRQYRKWRHDYSCPLRKSGQDWAGLDWGGAGWGGVDLRRG